MKLILRIIWNNTFTMKSFKSMRALTFENTVFSIGTYTTIQTWVRFTTTFLWRKWNYKYFQDIIASSESLKQVQKLLTVFYIRKYITVMECEINTGYAFLWAIKMPSYRWFLCRIFGWSRSNQSKNRLWNIYLVQ